MKPEGPPERYGVRALWHPYLSDVWGVTDRAEAGGLVAGIGLQWSEEEARARARQLNRAA